MHLAAPMVTLLLHLSYRNRNYIPSIHFFLPPLGRESLKSPSVVSQVLPSPPHTRHRSSLASEPRMLSQPTCFKIKRKQELTSEISEQPQAHDWKSASKHAPQRWRITVINILTDPPTSVFVSFQHLPTAFQADSLFNRVAVNPEPQKLNATLGSDWK